MREKRYYYVKRYIGNSREVRHTKRDRQLGVRQTSRQTTGAGDGCMIYDGRGMGGSNRSCGHIRVIEGGVLCTCLSGMRREHWYCVATRPRKEKMSNQKGIWVTESIMEYEQSVRWRRAMKRPHASCTSPDPHKYATFPKQHERWVVKSL